MDRRAARDDVRCWLCGRRVERQSGAPNVLSHSDIPIHRECLEDRQHADAPPAQPGDVVYF